MLGSVASAALLGPVVASAATTPSPLWTQATPLRNAPVEPTPNALRAQTAVLANLALLDDETGVARAYVTYALDHQISVCLSYWPPGVVPTVDENIAFCASSKALSMQTLSRNDVAWVLASLPAIGVHPGALSAALTSPREPSKVKP